MLGSGRSAGWRGGPAAAPVAMMILARTGMGGGRVSGETTEGAFHLNWFERLVKGAIIFWSVATGFVGGITYLNNHGTAATFVGFLLHWALSALIRVAIVMALFTCLDVGARLLWRAVARGRVGAGIRGASMHSPARRHRTG